MAFGFLVSAPDRALIGSDALATIAATYERHFLIGNFQVELSLLSKPEIQELNATYRSINEPTDVLSFPTFAGIAEIQSVPKEVTALLGSIMICPEKAEAYNETLPQLVHHGLLHLLGLDHEEDMPAWQEKEQEVLRELAEAGLMVEGVPNDTL